MEEDEKVHTVSDTEEGSNYLESGDKRQRKISNKIRGVYTPYGRLKGIFNNEKKVEYIPLAKTNRTVFKKFSEILTENLAQMFEIKTGHVVTNSFFLDNEPGKWLSDEVLFKILSSSCIPFSSLRKERSRFSHGSASVVLPYKLEQYAGYDIYHTKEGVRFYSWSRLEGIYHNQRSGDCGPCATKFMEMHANGLGKEEMSRIKDNSVDRFRDQYAMDCYEEFVGDFRCFCNLRLSVQELVKY
ncbi:LOW QUALITY PROTEIN: hypothetical protein N665_2153s0003 [Sinapis alba]|nr:LOW QUALITY PROTEIN: hypothetical protein N665_2153s0003 [Sinapis alba]